MSKGVDAIIEALKVALEEARGAKDETWWKVETANRWINRLPGAWRGRWRDLKLQGDSSGEVDRKEFIGHLRATLAYLEANHKAGSFRRAWPWTTPSPPLKQDPIDADFDDVTSSQGELLTGKPVGLIK